MGKENTSPEGRKSEITRRTRAQYPSAYARKSSNRSWAVRYGWFRLRSFRRCELCRRPVQTQLWWPLLNRPEELMKATSGIPTFHTHPKVFARQSDEVVLGSGGAGGRPFSLSSERVTRRGVRKVYLLLPW